MLSIGLCYEKIYKLLGKIQNAHKSKKGHQFRSNSEKTKYIITSRHQNVVQNQNIVIGNLSFEKVEKFKYLRVMVTNTNEIHEGMKCRKNM